MARASKPIYTPHPWTEFEQPTPEQFAVWLEAMTHEERVELSRRMLQDRAAADRCFIEDHDNRLAELRARQQRDLKQMGMSSPPRTPSRPAAGGAS